MQKNEKEEQCKKCKEIEKSMLKHNGYSGIVEAGKYKLKTTQEHREGLGLGYIKKAHPNFKVRLTLKESLDLNK